MMNQGIDLDVTEGQIRRTRRALRRWGQTHFRPFPWRLDRDPFRSLVTEILLKQTNAERVVDVRTALLDRCPNAESLASVDSTELEQLIRRLGFARQRTSQLIALGRMLAGHQIPANLD